MTVRVTSIILLLAALGSLALGMATITFSPTLVTDLQALQQPLPAACVSDGIATYSGISLLAGTAPAVNTACLHGIQDFGAAQVGIQPLTVAGALLIVATLVMNMGGWRGRGVANAAGPLAAIGLLVAGVLVFPAAFEGRFGVSSSAVAGEPAVGLPVVCALLLAVPVIAVLRAGSGWARRSLAPLEEGRDPRRRAGG